MIEVRDLGRGMSAERVNAVLQPGPGESGSPPRFPLSGLQICRAMVASFGGRMRILSAPGTGTTVIVELPFQNTASDS